MKFSTSEPGLAISALTHVALLVVGLVTFSSTPPFPENEEAIAVEMVDPSALTQVTRGERKAEKVQEQPLTRAERKAEIVENKEAGEAKVDTPAPPTRPADIKVAEDNATPPPPQVKPVPKPDEAELRKAAEARIAETKIAEAKAAAAEAKAAADARAAARAAETKAAEARAEERREELARLAEQAELASRAKQAEVEAKAAERAKAEARAEAAARAKAEEARAEAAKAEAARAAQVAKAKAEAAEAAREQAEAEAAAKAEAVAKAEAAAKAKAIALAKAKADSEAKARRDAEAAKKFNVADISKLLQSKEASSSIGAAAPQINRTASLGVQTGTGQKLNPSMRGQLMGLIKDQLHRCWQPPIGAASSTKPVIVSVRFSSNLDGTLASEPAVTNSSPDPMFRPTADTATRAVRRCSPLRIPAQFTPFYDDWKTMIVNFDTSDT